MNILHFMEIMVYNYGKTKSKEDRTKILRKGACQILLIGFFPFPLREAFKHYLADFFR